VKPRSTTGRGPIEANALYPLQVFLRRLGIGRHSLTGLRKRGLPVRMIGTRAIIDGTEAIEALRKIWKQDETTNP